MSNEQQPTGFLNRSSVVLFLVFTIPAALSLAGMFYVAQQGRVPGGTDSFCETMLNEDTYLRINIYAYRAGLVQFETQSFKVSDDGDTWQELFTDTIPAPQPVSCESSITQLDASNLILQNQKSIAWSADAGQTWQVHHVCDEPRPTRGRCDAETLNYAEISLNTDGTGELVVHQSVVDEFEEPQRDANGNPIVDQQWQLITTDAGESWILQVLD